jgi:hypothetical protein
MERQLTPEFTVPALIVVDLHVVVCRVHRPVMTRANAHDQVPAHRHGNEPNGVTCGVCWNNEADTIHILKWAFSELQWNNRRPNRRDP